MQRTGSEEHARRSDGAARQKVTVESSEQQRKFACRRMQREEESSSGDAIPAADSARREECNDTLHDCCTALRVEERSEGRGKMVADSSAAAAANGQRRSACCSRRSRLSDDAMYAGSHVHCVVHGPGKCAPSIRVPIAEKCLQQRVRNLAHYASRTLHRLIVSFHCTGMFLLLLHLPALVIELLEKSRLKLPLLLAVARLCCNSFASHCTHPTPLSTLISALHSRINSTHTTQQHTRTHSRHEQVRREQQQPTNERRPLEQRSHLLTASPLLLSCL